MQNFTAIIVDDEPKLREVLDIKIKKYCPAIKVLGEAKNASQAYELIIANRPQIVFLDISMPGESGFDLLERFEDITFEVIFVTGYNDYAIDALKVSAVDYLLKPLKTQELINAVRKAIKRLENINKIKNYDILKHNLNNIGDQNTKIAIPGIEAYDFISIGEIIRLEGWQKYTKFHLKNGKQILSSYNIGVFKEMLEKYDFFSVHKSHLINTKYINKYIKDGTLVMDDQSFVPVARRRREEFLSKIINVIK